MSGWRLLLTRPVDESQVLATQLSAAGVYSSTLALLEIQLLAVSTDIRNTLLSLDRYAAVVVVSKPAARLALALLDEFSLQLHALQSPPQWFSVGDATAGILQAHGLTVQFPETAGDSEALLALGDLQRAASLPGACVLIMRGEGGRGVLGDGLRGFGATVDYLQLYRRVAPAYPPGTLARQVADERLNALMVSSGQGFQHLHELAGDAWPQLARLPLFVPSLRVAELARAAGALNVVDCRGANATALLAALREHPVPAL